MDDVDLRRIKAEAWDECTNAHHHAAVAQGVPFAHPGNPYLTADEVQARSIQAWHGGESRG